MTGPLADTRLIALLDTHAPWRPIDLVPELSAWQAHDELPLWQALEVEAGCALPPPFFCVAWPGSQALASAMAIGTIDVRGARVADIGAGSGLASAAAMAAGAASVRAFDIDPLALRAARELGRRHGVVIETSTVDPLAEPTALADIDIIVAGDLIYQDMQRPPLARAVEAWQRRSTVVLADSGRPFFESGGLRLVCVTMVRTSSVVDGTNERTVRVYRSP